MIYEVYQLFVDYLQAYDSIDRNALHKLLQDYEPHRSCYS